MELLAPWQTFALIFVSGCVCALWTPNTSRKWGNLAVCLTLLCMACLHAKYMLDLPEIFDLLSTKYEMTVSEATKAKEMSIFWSGISTLIVGGVGVNLLSNWIDS